MKISSSILALAAFLGTTIWSGTGECASFTGLGDLPGGVYRSIARAVSADGSVIVGASRVTDFGDGAFRWTAETGIVALTDVPEGHFTSLIDAYGISADGSVIAGVGRAGFNTEGYRWTEADGYVGLSDLPGGVFS
jgi:probable HAF family extracellular repeat protein